MNTTKKRISRITLSILLVVFLILGGIINVAAQSGYAYSFGGEFYLPQHGYNYEDIKQTAAYCALMNYKSYYNPSLTYSYVNSQRINSDLTYFSCHGDINGLYFPNNGLTISRGTSNGSNVIGLSSWTLSNNKLMVFDACETAQGSSNICTTAISRGADCVLGWTEVISTDSIYWLKRFYNRLATGNTISASVAYADSYNDYSDPNIKSHRLYGNGNQVLKKASPSRTNTLEKPDSRVQIIPTITFSYDSTDYSILETAIKSKFPSFNLDDYQINISSTCEGNEDFVVDFNKIVNGCWTSSGYTMIFTKEQTNVIYDNTLNNPSSISSHKVNDIDIFNAKIMASNFFKANNQTDEIRKQTGKMCYNFETDTYFYRVYTSFGPKGTNYERIMIYDYQITEA